MPPDGVAKCHAAHSVKVMTLLSARRHIVYTSCRHRPWRCARLSPSEVHRSTTPSSGMGKLPYGRGRTSMNPSVRLMVCLLSVYGAAMVMFWYGRAGHKPAAREE